MCRLSKLAAQIQTGPFGSQLHESDYIRGGIPVINPAHIIDSKLIPDERSTVDDATAFRLSRHRLKAGDIIMGRRGEIGRCAVVEPEQSGWLCGTGCLLIRLNNSDPRFVSLVVRNRGFSEVLALNAVGSTMLNLNPGIVGRALLPVPPLDEQHRIADLLDRETAKIDDLIAKKQNLVNLLNEALAVRLDSILLGRMQGGNLSDSGYWWMGFVPSHWRLVPLRRLTRYISYGFTNPMPVESEGPFMVTANDIGDGIIKYDTARRTSYEAFRADLTDKSRPHKGDILITKDGTLGRVAVADGTPLCINQSVALLRINSQIASVAFIQNALRSLSYQEKMLFDAGGTTIKHIYITKLVKMPIALPPPEEQQRIVNAVETERKKLMALIDRIRRVVETLTEYRSSLITAAVTGQIDVRNHKAQGVASCQ